MRRCGTRGDANDTPRVVVWPWPYTIEDDTENRPDGTMLAI
ncbi:MAG: hypothetical protein WC294_05000 [Methanoregula sp.]